MMVINAVIAITIAITQERDIAVVIVKMYLKIFRMSGSMMV